MKTENKNRNCLLEQNYSYFSKNCMLAIKPVTTVESDEKLTSIGIWRSRTCHRNYSSVLEFQTRMKLISKNTTINAFTSYNNNNNSSNNNNNKTISFFLKIHWRITNKTVSTSHINQLATIEQNNYDYSMYGNWWITFKKSC